MDMTKYLHAACSKTILEVVMAIHTLYVHYNVADTGEHVRTVINTCQLHDIFDRPACSISYIK